MWRQAPSGRPHRDVSPASGQSELCNKQLLITVAAYLGRRWAWRWAWRHSAPLPLRSRLGCLLLHVISIPYPCLSHTDTHMHTLFLLCEVRSRRVAVRAGPAWLPLCDHAAPSHLCVVCCWFNQLVQQQERVPCLITLSCCVWRAVLL